MATSHLLCAGTEACADEVDLKQLSQLGKDHKQICNKKCLNPIQKNTK